MKSVDKSEPKSKPEAVKNPVKKTGVNTAWRTAPQHGNPTEHGKPDQAALQQILTKMDAQFLEIKETLYFRKIWGHRDDEEHSKFHFSACPLSKIPSKISSGPRTKASFTPGRSKVHPSVDTQTNDSDSESTKPINTNGSRDSACSSAPASAIDQSSPSAKAAEGDDINVNHKSNAVKPAASLASFGVAASIAKFKAQRDLRPKPPTISDMYDDELASVTSRFAERQFKPHEHKVCFLCCCGRNHDLDEYCRQSLWESCSAPIYFWLLITGVIPTKRIPWLIPLLWFIPVVLKVGFLFENIRAIYEDIMCNHMANNCVSGSLGLSQQGHLMAYNVFHIMSILSNVLILAPLVQSREFRCLLSYVGHHRVQGSVVANIVLVICAVVLLVLGTVEHFAIVALLEDQQLQMAVVVVSTIEFFIGIAAYSTAFVFWVIQNAVATCYADFAVDMLESAHTSLNLYTPGGNHEIALMCQLKRVVSLCATITEQSRVALGLPLVAGFTYIFFTLYAGFTVSDVLKTVFNSVAKVLAPALLPTVIALFTTYEGSMLDRLITLSQFLNLAKFVQDNPSHWMITQRTSLSVGLLAKLGFAVVVIGSIGGALREATSALDRSPLWAQRRFDYGSCSDHEWNGLEDHIDCGGPLSGCPLTCAQKYGDYLLIEASRQCDDIQGYVEINTQRACEIAYVSFQRKRPNSSSVNRVSAAVILSDTSAGETDLRNVTATALRCGSYANTEWLGSKIVTFPALLSAAALEHSLSEMAAWRDDPLAGIRENPLHDEERGRYFSAGVLCMAQSQTCSSHSTDFREPMTCATARAPKANASWIVASQPWVNQTSKSFFDSRLTYNNPVSVEVKGGCAHVTLTPHVSLMSVSPQSGGHVVFVVSCAPAARCNVTTRVTSESCSEVAALVSVLGDTTREKGRHELSAVCESEKGVQTDMASGDHVHVLADVTSGSFGVDLCI